MRANFSRMSSGKIFQTKDSRRLLEAGLRRPVLSPDGVAGCGARSVAENRSASAMGSEARLLSLPVRRRVLARRWSRPAATASTGWSRPRDRSNPPATKASWPCPVTSPIASPPSVRFRRASHVSGASAGSSTRHPRERGPPGIIKTPMHPAEPHAARAAHHLVGRMGEISDAVDAILYAEAGGVVTGEILHVDGGRSAGH